MRKKKERNKKRIVLLIIIICVILVITSFSVVLLYYIFHQEKSGITAIEGYSVVKESINETERDLNLILVKSEEIYSDGTAGYWEYYYMNINLTIVTCVTVTSGNTISILELNPNEWDLTIQVVILNWTIDSNGAIEIAYKSIEKNHPEIPKDEISQMSFGSQTPHPLEDGANKDGIWMITWRWSTFNDDYVYQMYIDDTTGAILWSG